MKWVTKNGVEQTAPGLYKTNEQMFFLAYAQVGVVTLLSYNHNGIVLC